MSSASRTTAILAKRLRTSSTRGLATTSINQNASTWTRPLPEGANPAYDASLAFLAQHSTNLLSKAERLRSSLSSAEGETKSQIEIALKKTELEARIARPETRWIHDNVTDLSTGVDSGDLEALNLLAERRWRKEGRLDRLMERVLSMKVVPDLIALPTPEIDLTVAYSGSSDPVPGDYLLPSQTIEKPQISLKAFTNDETEQLYTLVMVDPDFPDPEHLSFKEFCHWIVPNIPISRTTTSIPSSITSSLDYQPPHPCPETPYHRYTLLLLRQPSPTAASADQGDKLDSSATTAFLPTTPEDRSTFNLRDWMMENNFATSPSDASSVKGVFMFREGGKGFGQKVGYKKTSSEWKEEEKVVNGIWREVWGRDRAVYEKAPKEERFGYPLKY